MFRKKLDNQVREVTVDISLEKCTGCTKCFQKCRNGAIEIKYEKNYAYAYWAYPRDCNGCGKCATICKQGAIEVTEITGSLQPQLINYKNR